MASAWLRPPRQRQHQRQRFLQGRQGLGRQLAGRLVIGWRALAGRLVNRRVTLQRRF